eukprot:CAMPEP_0197495704 /NCGR_PEP_ID=MMETSP1311-20131121/38217_1 /TAXON_ID=464262 /ORGANISM="Genus nov. species nov., Strain RCC856" /LENGTH=153 /DNA_ID=CAMNT_0043041225 /DNA_START=36 /DNA_END=494 /DNA_ORIENTATION=+
MYTRNKGIYSQSARVRILISVSLWAWDGREVVEGERHRQAAGPVAGSHDVVPVEDFLGTVEPEGLLIVLGALAQELGNVAGVVVDEPARDLVLFQVHDLDSVLAGEGPADGDDAGGEEGLAAEEGPLGAVVDHDDPLGGDAEDPLLGGLWGPL